MNLSPEIKAQLAEQKKQCVFCKIISKEIPGKIVFEDAKTIAILDIYPALKGHTIFLPKEHYPILPYLPEEEFEHFFGLLPALAKAVKDGIVCTAFNLFIANGQAAGQQAPHFLVHLLPRDPGDGFFNFLFKMKRESLGVDKISAITANLARLMQQYFAQSPQSWHVGKYERQEYLAKLSGTTIYEDEKVLVQLPVESAAAGQIDVYSKVEQIFLEKLSVEDSIHFFKVGSYVASLAFEIFQAQGTTMLLRSGTTEEHPAGILTFSIIPRKADDSLQGMLWQPKQPKYNLDGVMSKIKDKTWKVKYEKTQQQVAIPVVARMLVPDSPSEEIKKAIEKMKS